jgi:hypothetical protein
MSSTVPARMSATRLCSAGELSLASSFMSTHSGTAEPAAAGDIPQHGWGPPGKGLGSRRGPGAWAMTGTADYPCIRRDNGRNPVS